MLRFMASQANETPAVVEVAETVTGVPAHVICPEGAFTESCGASTTVTAFEFEIPFPQELTPFTVTFPEDEVPV